MIPKSEFKLTSASRLPCHYQFAGKFLYVL